LHTDLHGLGHGVCRLYLGHWQTGLGGISGDLSLTVLTLFVTVFVLGFAVMFVDRQELAALTGRI
jgi:hypothetical protein